MYRNILILILLISIIGCTHFIKVPTRTDDDYFHQKTDYTDYTIKFIEIENDLSLLKNYNQIYLFASWCAPCYSYLANYSEENRGTALVSINYNIEFLEKKFHQNIDTIYILSNSSYGSIEKEKILRFSSILLDSTATLTGVPQIFYRVSSDKFQRLQLR